MPRLRPHGGLGHWPLPSFVAPSRARSSSVRMSSRSGPRGLLSGSLRLGRPSLRPTLAACRPMPRCREKDARGNCRHELVLAADSCRYLQPPEGWMREVTPPAIAVQASLAASGPDQPRRSSTRRCFPACRSGRCEVLCEPAGLAAGVRHADMDAAPGALLAGLLEPDRHPPVPGYPDDFCMAGTSYSSTKATNLHERRRRCMQRS
jgi:hypothetical protein